MIKNFSCSENLSKYIDSMLFDSGECIASMDYTDDTTGKKVSLDLKVCGHVKVSFEEVDYVRYSDFPEKLKKLIKNNREWELDERVYVDENNWFEFIYSTEKFSDGIIMEEDVTSYTEETLKVLMEEICKEILLNSK